MKFTIAREEILAGLYLAQGVVEKRPMVPMLANVKVTSAPGGIILSATDQEITVHRFCTAAVEEEGAFSTGARVLYEVVRKASGEEIQVRTIENGWIEIRAGSSKVRLVGMDPSEFPPIPKASADLPSIKIPSETLGDMIEYTVFAICNDESRIVLNGLYLEPAEEPGRARMVATDGHRLAVVMRPVEGTSIEHGVIIPRKAVNELRKMLESGTGGIDFAVEGGVIHARCGPVEMSMRLIEGEFPDYKQVIPADPSCILRVDIAPFLTALRQMAVVWPDRSNGSVRFQMAQGKLQLSSHNSEVGEVEDEIEVEYEGEERLISFNVFYLIDMLDTLPVGGRVELALVDDESPGVLRDVGDPDYFYIVMPMRL